VQNVVEFEHGELHYILINWGGLILGVTVRAMFGRAV
jgi:hypothetical protein